MMPTFVRGKIDGNGRETISCCLDCQIDKYGICRGTMLHLVNDHKSQTAKIFIGNRLMETFKGEVLEQIELERWMKKNGYEPLQEGECSRVLEELKK